MLNIHCERGTGVLINWFNDHPDLEKWIYEEIRNYFNLRNFTCEIKRTKGNLKITIIYDNKTN